MSDQRPKGFDYQRYLASREWALLKRAIRERSEGRCERCLIGSYEQTHHMTYARIGHEELTDLLAVCRPCHEFISGFTDVDRAEFIVIRPVAPWSIAIPDPYHAVDVSGPVKEVLDRRLADDSLDFYYNPRLSIMVFPCKGDVCSLCVASGLWK